MSYLQGIILGFVQGVAEFLPISSSGHLLVLRNFMDLQEAPKLFDILLHLATFIVICVVFRKRIWDLIKVLFELKKIKTDINVKKRFNIVLMIIVATFLTGALGVVIDSLEISSPKFTYAMFIVTGAFLFGGKYLSGKIQLENLGLKRTLIIGVSQGIGVLPGISRSGITITTGVFTGLNREAASEFSFIIALPAILGAVVLDLGDTGELLSVVPLSVVIVSFLTTVVVGFVSLKLLLKLINSGKFHYFSFYLIPLGILGLILG